MLQLELDLMEEDTNMPVYFATESKELSEMYTDLKHSAGPGRESTAIEGL